MKGAVGNAEIEHFRSLVAQHIGLHFDGGKLDFLADVLRQRMERTGCGQFSSYHQRIAASAAGPEELRALAEQLTVCETYFFRYADHFRAFAETVIPERMEARAHCRQLRILSAGCATGDEAYSLAILIRERLPALASWEIAIRGVDVNVSALKKAQCGRYTSWSLRETPPGVQSKYFRAEGRDFVLDGTVKSAVTFEERNLTEADPLFWRRDAFDVIFCRNVTMYFTPEATRAAIARMAGSLAAGGFLFLGHAETLRGISPNFHLRHTHETFYYQRRQDCEMRSCADIPQPPADGDPFPGAVPAVMEAGDSWFDIIRRASERIANLTAESGRPPVCAPVKTGTREAARAMVWDRTLVLELLRKERFGEAVEILRALPLESHMDPDAQLLLAVLLTNSGELTEAEKVCERLLRLDELNAGAHYLIALGREHAGDRDAAVEHDQTAVYLDSAFAMPHLHIGLMAKRFAEMQTAKRELGCALDLLDREDASRILLFGGGFTREALAAFCRTELHACGNGA